MAFESRRLRVQLPCDPHTIVEEAQTCRQGGSPAFHCRVSCGIPSDCAPNTCEVTCGQTYCDPSCDLLASFPTGTMLVDAAQLPMIRARLEAQLREIEAAERAVREREAGDQADG